MSNLKQCTVLNAISHKGERVERGATLMLTADEVARYQGHISVADSEDVKVAEESAPVEPSKEVAAGEDKKTSRLSAFKKRK